MLFVGSLTTFSKIQYSTNFINLYSLRAYYIW